MFLLYMQYLDKNIIDKVTVKVIGNKIFVCGDFVHLQKVFYTVDHNILLCELSNYGIRDITNC